MDFLKACHTNIHCIERVLQTAFRIYTYISSEETPLEAWSRAESGVIKLRSQNYLCALVDAQLWIFGETGEETDFDVGGVDDPHWQLVHTGVPETAPAQSNGVVPKDVLLEAIEASIAYKLAKDSAASHVAPWTWIYTAESGFDLDSVDSIVVRLQPKLTSNGDLYILSDVAPSPCLPLDLLLHRQDTALILAPFGHRARLLTDSSQKAPVVNEAWKSHLSQALSAWGIVLADNTQWVSLEFLDDPLGSACIWPARLCFILHKANPELDVLVSDDREWRRWFISTEEGAIFRHPLATAEEWYKTGPERERAGAAQEHGQVIVTDITTDKSADIHEGMPAVEQDTTATTSPPFSQRAHDHQAIMSGIYPTPPDGYAPGPQTSQINAATPSATQSDHATVTLEPPSIGHELQAKSSNETASVDQMDVQNGHQDLFEDVGGIEFEENAIDDADFSFFDEPDEEPLAPMSQSSEYLVERKPELVHEHIGSPQFGDGKQNPDSQRELQNPDDASDSVTETTQDVLEKTISTQSTATDPPPIPLPQFSQTPDEPKRPLSPFGIRERLLPPPVPASIAQVEFQNKHQDRRNSTFAPIAFREGFSLSSRYTSTDMTKTPSRLVKPRGAVPDIHLPSTCKRSRRREGRHTQESVDSDDEDSNQSSYDSSSSDTNDRMLPPALPWDRRKRKRKTICEPQDRGLANQDITWPDNDSDDSGHVDALSEGALLEALNRHTQMCTPHDVLLLLREPIPEGVQLLSLNYELDSDSHGTPGGLLPDIESFYDFGSQDLICIAQVASEQAVSVIGSVGSRSMTAVDEISTLNDVAMSIARKSSHQAIETVLPASENYEIGKLASMREPLVRPQANPGKSSAGQPRVPQRSDGAMVGPDYFPLPFPYVKIQRGSNGWEMLPTSLSFWEALGLAPTSGPKNLRAFCVFPFNEDLQRLVELFLGELATSYENCKLGSHVHMRDISECDEQDNFEDGMAPVDLSEDTSLSGALKAYATTCTELGKALSTIVQQEPDRAIVVYMTSPFHGLQAQQHLCACFWLLWEAYRENLPKQQKNQSTNDIFLQLLPINLFAAYDALVVPDAQQMAALAREVYDRCPPPATFATTESTSLLPNLAAPFVELAGSAPKRIGFQLAPEPPTDLLHEGSVLHLAYVYSSDRQWLTVTWIDNTGKHQSSTAFCLRGRSFAEVAESVWEYTREILAVRQVLWRVFIVTTHDIVNDPILACWRSLASKPLAQALCVTMLAIEQKPLVQLLTPQLQEEGPSNAFPDAGFLTPASTPTANILTSSPDVSGQGGNAPPTPAPSEAAASTAENDPDAQLVDLTEEAWGVLLDPKLRPLLSNPGLSNGVIYKRGKIALEESERLSEEALPALGVSLFWTIQVKPQGAVDEGSGKQADLTLREVLRLYRNLAVLTKAKGLAVGKTALMPVHLATAMRGAEGLNGLLPPLSMEI